MSWSTRGGLLALVAVLALAGACARSPEAKKARYLERGERYFKQQQYAEAVIEYRNVLRIDGNNSQAVKQLGLAHYQLGQAGQAFRFLLKAQELEPDNQEIALKLAAVYLLGRKAAEARGQAERILDRDPKNLDALILWSGAASSRQELDAAVRRLETARAELDPESRYHLTLANLYRRSGNREAAGQAFQAALARDPRSVEAHLELGSFYAEQNARPEAEQHLKTAASLAPAGSWAQIRLADFYVATGRSDEAKRLLEETTSKAPGYLPAWRRLGEMALSEGRLDDAKKAVDAIFEKKTDDVEARLLLGRVHLARGDAAGASREFRTVVKAEPRFAAGHYQLGLALLQAGDVQQAKAELKEATNISPNFTEATLALARVNLRTGAYQPAADDLEQLLKREPRLTAAYPLLGAAYLAQKKPAVAAEVARKFIAIAPQDARGPDILGLALAAQGKRSEAHQQFESALALSPGYLDPLQHLVALAVVEKQVDSAIQRVTRQAALVPKSGAHQALLGELYLARGNAKLAEEAFLRAIEFDPRLFEPYAALGSIYFHARQYDQALAKFADLTKANPNNPTPHMLSGIVYEAKGDIPSARAAYEKAIALNPRFAAAANNLAWIYSEQGGDKDKALQLAQSAKEEAPDDPRISDTLGWILYKRGVYQRALALLKESATKLPDNPQVQYHLGMAYHQVGERENARKALQLAVNSSEAFVGKDEARRTLAELR
jgi:tetratricopeptide (TPR) repeat protein